MLRPTAIDVKPLENFYLLLTFDNGEVKKYDCTPLIKGNFYGQLGSENYFKQVKTNNFSVEWPEGQDLCPDDLYYNSVPVSV